MKFTCGDDVESVVWGPCALTDDDSCDCESFSVWNPSLISLTLLTASVWSLEITRMLTNSTPTLSSVPPRTFFIDDNVTCCLRCFQSLTVQQLDRVWAALKQLNPVIHQHKMLIDIPYSSKWSFSQYIRFPIVKCWRHLNNSLSEKYLLHIQNLRRKNHRLVNWFSRPVNSMSPAL